MKRAAIVVFAFLAALSAGNAGAAIRECGTYRIEGRIASIAESGGRAEIVFLANEAAYTRIEFRVDASPETVRARLAAGARAELVLKLERSCEFQCAAELVDVARLLEPWGKAATFNSRTRPLQRSDCKN